MDLTLVPQRETGMTAYEMLLSESQERMIIVAHKGREKQIVEIFNKWELDAVVVGRVVEGNRLKIFHNGEMVADLPVDKLTDEAPKYNRPMAQPKSQGEKKLTKGLDSIGLAIVMLITFGIFIAISKNKNETSNQKH